MDHGTIYDLYKRDDSGEPLAARFRISHQRDGWLSIKVSADEPNASEQILILCSLVSGRFIVDVIDAATIPANESICGAVATGTISIPLRRASRKEDSR